MGKGMPKSCLYLPVPSGCFLNRCISLGYAWLQAGVLVLVQKDGWNNASNGAPLRESPGTGVSETYGVILCILCLVCR